MALQIALLLVACFAFAPVSECQIPGILNDCGEFTCPISLINLLQSECCVAREACCTAAENQQTGLPTVASECDGTICPSGLPDDMFYDLDNQLRNECCVYFRSGCCSAEENSFLNLLFQLAIGLSIGLFGLLVIIIFLIVCCCCCCC